MFVEAIISVNLNFSDFLPSGKDTFQFRYSLVVRTCGLHPQDPGSIPDGGTFDDRWCDAPAEVSLGRVIV